MTRAVKANGWSAEDALSKVQEKLTGVAATWYQTRECYFDQHPAGPEEGWRNFWLLFEQQFVGQDEQALWTQFEARTQAHDESVSAYADAIRRLAGRLQVNVNAGYVRSRFVKGLASPHVRAKLETLAYVPEPTFEAWAAAASHHELNLRRERKGGSSGGSSSNEEKKRASTAESSSTSSVSAELQKLLEEGLAKHMGEIKREIAGQKQTLARMQLQVDRTRGMRPPQPCFTCGGPHFKKNCPEELTKRGAVNQVTMAELLEMDVS